MQLRIIAYNYEGGWGRADFYAIALGRVGAHFVNLAFLKGGAHVVAIAMGRVGAHFVNNIYTYIYIVHIYNYLYMYIYIH